MALPIIALLTDFGTQDPYTALMKAVILQRVEVHLVDITHHIPSGDVERGAFVLWQTWRYFPKGTVFLAVVDPGVGTHRLPVLAEAEGYRFIAPDNGLLSYLLPENARAWAIANPVFHLPNPSATFHGRDIFAPAAAYAAKGVPGKAFGPLVPALKRLPRPQCRLVGEEIHAQVLHADHFGNLITSAGVFQKEGDLWVFTPWLSEATPVYFTPTAVRLPDGEVVPIFKTFAEVPQGEIGAIVGSAGMIEIVANRQSAAEMLGLERGVPITVLGKRQ